MARSKYFSLNKYDKSKVNKMSRLTSLGFGLLPAVVLTKEDYAKEVIDINDHPIRVFDGILTGDEITPDLASMAQQMFTKIKTIPFTAISDDLPKEYDDLVISFRNSFEYFNYITALQTHIKHHEYDRHFKLSTQWLIAQAMGLPQSAEGPSMATYLDINANLSMVEGYEFTGIGTSTFWMEDPQAAMDAIDSIYINEMTTFKKVAQILDINPAKIMNFTPTFKKVMIMKFPFVHSEVEELEQSYYLKPLVYDPDAPDFQLYQ